MVETWGLVAVVHCRGRYAVRATQGCSGTFPFSQPFSQRNSSLPAADRFTPREMGTVPVNG